MSRKILYFLCKNLIKNQTPKFSGYSGEIYRIISFSNWDNFTLKTTFATSHEAIWLN